MGLSDDNELLEQQNYHCVMENRKLRHDLEKMTQRAEQIEASLAAGLFDNTKGGKAIMNNPCELHKTVKANDFCPICISDELTRFQVKIAELEVKIEECEACDGEGEIYVGSSFLGDEDYRICWTCYGTGKKPTSTEIASLRQNYEAICLGDLPAAKIRQQEAEASLAAAMDWIRVAIKELDAQQDHYCNALGIEYSASGIAILLDDFLSSPPAQTARKILDVVEAAKELLRYQNAFVCDVSAKLEAAVAALDAQKEEKQWT